MFWSKDLFQAVQSQHMLVELSTAAMFSFQSPFLVEQSRPILPEYYSGSIILMEKALWTVTLQQLTITEQIEDCCDI